MSAPDGAATCNPRSVRPTSRWTPLLTAVLVSSLLVACAEDEADGDGAATTSPTITLPTTTVTMTTTATSTEPPVAATAPPATAMPEDGSADEGPAPPRNVRLSGPLPDTSQTVTPGEGETGRVTVEWEAEDDVDGFRIYQRECDGTVVADAIEVGPDERQYGPLQPCRPGGDIGVSSFDSSGESQIIWAQAATGS